MKNIVGFIVLSLLLSCTSKESKIYQFRGDYRNGIYFETELLKEWTEEGPEEILLIENIGNGYGSPIVTDDKIYISGAKDSIALLFCFDLKGEVIWETEFGEEWIVNFPGSRSAPTLIDDLIYIGSGMGNLYCIDANTGEKIWSKNLKEDFEGILPRFGHSEAAQVDGDKVYWVPGGKKHNVVALNRFTGDLIWTNPGLGERSAYNSSELIELSERKLLVVFSAYTLMAFDRESGELLWNHEQDNTPLDKRDLGIGDTHSNTVLYDSGYIYYAAGDGNCGVKLALSEDGSEVSEVWRNERFDNYMGGIVKIDNYLYGGATRRKELFALDASTGQLTDSLKVGSGALIAADEMLYYYNQRGNLKLLAYDQGKITEISSFKITRGTKEHFSHPVIRNGVLYQRHGNVLMGYDIRRDREE